MNHEMQVENGERLRKIRGIRTRVGAAKEIGISCASLQAYEEGWRNPSPKARKLIADYYGVKEEDLFFDHEYYKKY